MSWFAEIMAQADKREFKHLQRFYDWIEESHPEAMEEWLKKMEAERALDIRWWI